MREFLQRLSLFEEGTVLEVFKKMIHFWNFLNNNVTIRQTVNDVETVKEGDD
jgi:hypothetical protein